jgi:hypothetical protein
MVLPEQAECFVAVEFKPNTAVVHNSNLVISYNGGTGNTNLSVPIQGTGQSSLASLRLTEYPPELP